MKFTIFFYSSSWVWQWRCRRGYTWENMDVKNKNPFHNFFFLFLFLLLIQQVSLSFYGDFGIQEFFIKTSSLVLSKNTGNIPLTLQLLSVYIFCGNNWGYLSIQLTLLPQTTKNSAFENKVKKQKTKQVNTKQNEKQYISNLITSTPHWNL